MNPSEPVVIHWFRRDLRLSDNLALHAAAATGRRVMPVFIFDPALLRGERFSPARLMFMLRTLASLQDAIRQRGGKLVIRHGAPEKVLPQLVETSAAEAVYANRDYSSYAVRRDEQLAADLPVSLHLFDDSLIHPPEQVQTQDGRPFVVFTPFKRQWLTLPKPLPAAWEDATLRFADAGEDAGALPTLEDLGVKATFDVPEVGEKHAQDMLETFAAGAIDQYGERRDHLLIDPFSPASPRWTSGLSPYLRFGALSPRMAYHAAMRRRAEAESSAARASVDTWISELVWREFYMHILYHFPHVMNTSFRREYEQVEYRHAPEELLAWQEGMTGYPVVDAAMRQLKAIGWMHNRARMITASFLTKDLLIYWREGETYFMRHLIDGDPAANNGGWQWSAGTGTDAQPYFRIFNPMFQSQKFDPEGHYIRHWVPELRNVPTEFIHTPWQMPQPPKDYPKPIVDHYFARDRTLAAFSAVKAQAQKEANP